VVLSGPRSGASGARASPLGGLLRSAVACRWLTAAAALLLASASLRFTLWNCPFLLLTQHRCPGCGLTRATAALAAGHVRAAVEQHAFAPVALLGIAVVAAAAFAPAGLRDRLAGFVERVDRGAWLSAALLIALFGYWGLRGVFGL
jgi:hypothetical protein